MTELRMRFAVQVPPERVWRALTEVDELEAWFCEHAEVDLAKGTYDFWGRYTIDNPGRDAGRHEVLGIDHGQALRIVWKFRGADTTVELTVDFDENDACHVAVLHSDLPEWQWDDGGTPENFWDTVLGTNLVGWLEGGDAGYRYDFSTRPSGDYQLSVDINSPTESVWRAVREQVATWEVQDRHSDRPLEILNLVEGRELTHTLPFGSQVVTFTLEGSGGRTRLTLIQSGFDDQGTLTEANALGFASTLNWIKVRAETGEDLRRRAGGQASTQDGAAVLVNAVRGKTDHEIMVFAGAVGGPERLLDMVFAGMASRIDSTHDCTVGFSVGADYVVTVTDGEASYRAVDTAGVAPAVVHMNTPDFLRMIVREFSPEEALATGRLAIHGDRAEAERLFTQLPAATTPNPR